MPGGKFQEGPIVVVDAEGHIIGTSTLTEVVVTVRNGEGGVVGGIKITNSNGVEVGRDPETGLPLIKGDVLDLGSGSPPERKQERKRGLRGLIS